MALETGKATVKKHTSTKIALMRPSSSPTSFSMAQGTQIDMGNSSGNGFGDGPWARQGDGRDQGNGHGDGTGDGITWNQNPYDAAEQDGYTQRGTGCTDFFL